jgi:hypothetical protein
MFDISSKLGTPEVMCGLRKLSIRLQKQIAETEDLSFARMVAFRTDVLATGLYKLADRFTELSSEADRKVEALKKAGVRS